MKRMYAVNANRVFLLSIIVSQGLLILVSGFGVNDIMLLQFLVEVFMILPAVYCLAVRRQPIKSELGIYGLKRHQWLLLIPLAICVDKIAEFVNVLSQFVTPNIVGNHMVELILKYPLPIAFFVIAVTPAICEELIYRGVLYRGYRKSGVVVAVVLTGFLFGIMHMNLNQFSYAFVLGILFAVINECTGSILPSVVMHLYINGRSTVVLYVAVNYLKGLRKQYIAAEAAGNTELMESLLTSAQGVPIQKADWLQEYMNAGTDSISETLLSILPVTLLAIVVASFIIGYFIKEKRKAKIGRIESVENGFEILKENLPEKREKTSFKTWISPSLVAGILICLLFMMLQ